MTTNKGYGKVDIIYRVEVEEALCGLAQRIFEKYPAGCIFAHYSWEKSTFESGVYWYLYANFSATESGTQYHRGYFRDDIFTPISSKLLSGTSLSHRKKWALSTIREREVRMLSITRPPWDSSEIGDRLSQLSSVTTRTLFLLLDLGVCPFTWIYLAKSNDRDLLDNKIDILINLIESETILQWAIDDGRDLIIFLDSSAEIFNNPLR